MGLASSVEEKERVEDSRVQDKAAMTSATMVGEEGEEGDDDGDAGLSRFLSLPSSAAAKEKREREEKEPEMSHDGNVTTITFPVRGDPVMTQGVAILSATARQLFDFESIYPIEDEKSIYIFDAKVKAEFLAKEVKEGGNGRVVAEFAHQTHDAIRVSVDDGSKNDKGERTLTVKAYVVEITKLFHIHEVKSTLMLELRNVGCSMASNSDDDDVVKKVETIFWAELDSLACTRGFYHETLF